MAKLLVLCIFLGLAVSVFGDEKKEKDKECPRMCPMNLDYVCGTDGQTYPNQCSLSVAACQSLKAGRGRIGRRFKGKCDNPPRALEQRKKSSFYRMTPEIQEQLQARKKGSSCLRPCPRNLDFVCGSDGQTYSNQCVMKVKACEKRKTITVAARGPCRSGGSGPGGLMRMLASVKEVCPTLCPASYAPVCGTNQRTYPNECALKYHSCKSKNIVRVEHQGACKSAPARPPAPAAASLRSAAAANRTSPGEKDECVKACYMNLDPACGTDGKTYSNSCELRAQACRTKSGVKMAHKGKC